MRFLQTDFIRIQLVLYMYLNYFHQICFYLFFNVNDCYFQGASCLARSLKVVNEALTSMDLGFNEIRVTKKLLCSSTILCLF